MNTIFEVYDRCADSPLVRPLTLTELVERVDANSVMKTLIRRLFIRGSLNEQDLGDLLGETAQVKSWCPRDFAKEHPEEIDMCEDGIFVEGYGS